MSADVVTIGELLIDFTPVKIGNETGFIPKPGGAPANVAAAVSKLGGISAFIGKVGDDQFGNFLKTALDSVNVNTAGVIFDKDAPTTLAFVHLDNGGERSFSFYRKYCADTQLTVKELDMNIIDRCKVLHFGSVSLTDSPTKDAVLYAAERASRKGSIVSFDPNFRPALWLNEENAVDEIRQALSLVDIIKVSHDEMEQITGNADVAVGTASLQEYGAKLVLVTLGSNGSYFRYMGYAAHVPSCKVETIDTNGAGDAFLGGLLYRLTRFSDPLSISPCDMEKAVMFANAVGALTTTKAGAITALPTMDEVIAVNDLYA